MAAIVPGPWHARQERSGGRGMSSVRLTSPPPLLRYVGKHYDLQHVPLGGSAQRTGKGAGIRPLPQQTDPSGEIIGVDIQVGQFVVLDAAPSATCRSVQAVGRIVAPAPATLLEPVLVDNAHRGGSMLRHQERRGLRYTTTRPPHPRPMIGRLSGSASLAPRMRIVNSSPTFHFPSVGMPAVIPDLSSLGVRNQP